MLANVNLVVSADTNSSGDEEEESYNRYNNSDNYSGNSRSLSDLKNELSILSANGKSVEHIVEQIAV